MVGEPATRGSDQPPSADEIGNHHWPTISNYFQEHGNNFMEHHSHPGMDKSMLRLVHERSAGVLGDRHAKTAQFHMAMEMYGCRSNP